MVAVLVVVIALLIVGAASLVAGVCLAFSWLRRFAPQREAELLTELAALRATQRLGTEAGVARRAMLRLVDSEVVEPA